MTEGTCRFWREMGADDKFLHANLDTLCGHCQTDLDKLISEAETDELATDDDIMEFIQKSLDVGGENCPTKTCKPILSLPNPREEFKEWFDSAYSFDDFDPKKKG